MGMGSKMEPRQAIDGVQVQLYNDMDGNGVYTPDVDTLYAPRIPAAAGCMNSPACLGSLCGQGNSTRWLYPER